MSPEERARAFFSKTSPEPNTGCWIWDGASWGNGAHYGVCWDGHKHVPAHRFAWTCARGAIPAGLSVLHRCDNPACVNPDHLFVGTQKDNVADMLRKGRGNRPKGERHHQAKLSAAEVRTIYAQMHDSNACATWTAQEFGVARSTVWKIATGRLWVSVTHHPKPPEGK